MNARVDLWVLVGDGSFGMLLLITCDYVNQLHSLYMNGIVLLINCIVHFLIALFGYQLH